jgi:hypothetical protein
MKGYVDRVQDFGSLQVLDVPRWAEPALPEVAMLDPCF